MRKFFWYGMTPYVITTPFLRGADKNDVKGNLNRKKAKLKNKWLIEAEAHKGRGRRQFYEETCVGYRHEQ